MTKFIGTYRSPACSREKALDQYSDNNDPDATFKKYISFSLKRSKKNYNHRLREPWASVVGMCYGEIIKLII